MIASSLGGRTCTLTGSQHNSIVSLPKQLAVVWLGYEFGVNKHNSDPAKAKEQKIISLSVFFGTALATVLALYIVYM